MAFSIVITLLVAYLLGNLNGAVCISHMMQDDVRSHGSGNAGLTNFIRNYGAGRAVYVIAIDGGKAAVACLCGRLLMESYGLAMLGSALGGLGVLLGHCCPALLGFRGGKGILSGLFVAVLCDWRIALLILGVFALFYLVTQYVSLGSVLAAVAFAIGFVLWHGDDLPVMLLGIAMAALTIFMHRQNIARLIKGQERKTNLFSKKKQ